MKKIILSSLALAAGIALGHSQGTISIANSTAAYYIYTTNTVTDVGGKAGGAGSYEYTVLTSAYGGAAPSISDSALDSSLWTWTGVTASSYGVAGGISSQNTQSTLSGSWGAPTGASYSTAPTVYYVIVGWSTLEGTSWATVSGELANNGAGLIAGGYFGTSILAYEEAGGGPSSLTATPLVAGNSITGLTGAGLSGVTFLDAVPTPEPTTIALGVLGAASLLALRRKKA